ncbi:MAG: UvrD-helicase domain-containing protein [Candidatus Izemoplasmatales bacterium]|jgi:DNA helicase-2/ATP-dependent DNA helicase PcrA|nr:3'-5' exonuclease [Candidatus Izemoplasmatales bacterium]
MGNIIFDKLNEQQIKAVKVVNGPVMAVAGAGSGKTRVLTNRVAYLIDEIGIPSNHILAITFTNRAADEMRTRIFRLINCPITGIWLSTFHAMGAKILRYDINYLGYGNDFQIIDDDDAIIVVKTIMKRLDYDVKKFSPKAIANLIESAKADETILTLNHMIPKDMLNIIFDEYQKFLQGNNLVDFQDLLVLVLKLFRNYPEVLKKYQDWFQYILVDEFQDTNDLQYEIVYLLAKNHRNLFIVGDEDQSIYAFRGANIQNIKKFMTDFPEHQKIILNQNYRSKTTILDAANAVIKHNRNRIPKDLFSTLGEGDKIIHFKAESDDEEAYYIYNKIKQLSKAGLPFRDMAVFYRNNAMSRKFEDILLKYNIPHKVIGNISFYKRKEIKDIIAYLHLLVNRGDDYAFSRVYNEPRRGIGEMTFDRMVDYAKQHNLKLMDVIEADVDLFPQSTMERLKTFKTIIDELHDNLETVNLLVTYDTLLDKSGYMGMLKMEGLSGEKQLEAQRRIDNLNEFKTVILEKIKEYDSSISNTEKLIQILTELALREEAEVALNDDDYVSLMTMHSAKGLEFKIVFLTCFEQTLFPSNQSLMERTDIEEERRLFYVALTRAKDQVVITNAKSRFMYGHYQENLDSEFIAEIDDKLVEHLGLAKPRKRFAAWDKTEVESRSVPAVAPGYVPTQNDLVIGDKVRHQVFGEGIIVMIDQDKATIAFKTPVGIKILMKDHPSIQKV